MDSISRAISDREGNEVWGVREIETAQKMKERLIVLSAAGSTQRQNREVPTEFGNMEVICGHNQEQLWLGYRGWKHSWGGVKKEWEVRK